VLASLPSDLVSGLVALHRADLHAVLESAAGEVRLGCAVTSVEQDPSTVVARCADGERYSPWHPPIAGVLEATEEAVILRNDVYFVEPLPSVEQRTRSAAGRRRSCRDARVGLGAAQAIEDAVVLVSQLANQRDVPTALEAFEATRRPRVEAVLRVSRRADRVAQMASPLGCRLRNAALRLLPATAQRRDLGLLIQHRV
jgi:2-polyprenyl-6-methoxyphenol hydroxylase-like FAD-dependent oxidoreductase